MGRKKRKEGGLRDGMERGRERKWRPKRLGMCVSCRKFFSTFHARTHEQKMVETVEEHNKAGGKG